MRLLDIAWALLFIGGVALALYVASGRLGFALLGGASAAVGTVFAYLDGMGGES